MYYDFEDDEGMRTGSVEVFWNDGFTLMQGEGVEEDYAPKGWYWWPCFPGCLPDGEAHGPFKTEEEACHDAKGED